MGVDDLLPPIAAGDLALSSVPELVASALRAAATGTVVLAESRDEARLFVRYGWPCGVTQAGEAERLAQMCAEDGLVDDAEKLVSRAGGSRQRALEIVAKDAGLPADALQALATRHHARELLRLCFVRGGRYELRGWERPPDWTKSVRLDPLRLIVDAFAADELFDRRSALVEKAERHRLLPGTELADLRQRLAFDAAEKRLVTNLAGGRHLAELAKSGRDEVEPHVLGLLLVGALELSADESTPPPPAPVLRAAESSVEDDILAGIEEAVGDYKEVDTGPLTIDAPREVTGPPVDLALLAAEEAVRLEATGETAVDAPSTNDELPLDLDLPEPDAADEPGEVLELDLAPPEPMPAPSGAAAVIVGEVRDVGAREPTPASRPPPERAPSASHDEVRRRMLQRALKNVGGAIFARDAEKSAPHDPMPADVKPVAVDPNLAKEVDERLARAKDDHFARLDLPRTAGDDDVKEAFLKLAKRFHPDHVLATGQLALKDKVRELFAQVKESYDVLVDPRSRARHVEFLESKSGKQPQRRPDDAKAAFQKAQILQRRGDLKNAEAELVLAVAADPTAAHLAALATVLFTNPQRRADAHEEIRDLVQRALKTQPPHDGAFVVAALVARADGDTEKSERYFRKALDLNPQNVEAAREVRLIDRRKPPEKKGLLERFKRK